MDRAGPSAPGGTGITGLRRPCQAHRRMWGTGLAQNRDSSHHQTWTVAIEFKNDDCKMSFLG